MVDANVKIRGGAADETGWTDDGTNVRLTTSTDKVGLGTASPVTPFDVFEDPTGIQDNTGGGFVVTYGGGTLVAGKLYYLHTDGDWTVTDADAVGTGADQALGIALGTDSSAGVLVQGYFDATTYLSIFSAGKAVYVDTAEASMNTTAPSGAGDFVRVVGYCTDTANVIYFNPSQDWVEL